jgi:transitional endoplasmic reticulum ATPase
MYVKSLKRRYSNHRTNGMLIKAPSQDFMGDEFAISEVFKKARQNSPCVVILEDLDSQINDQNRSFFLNELDGLQSNDGLLLIGSTNHLDRLDPGLSTRPSRFDRK